MHHINSKNHNKKQRREDQYCIQ